MKTADSVAENLKHYRLERGLTQRELARRAGLTPSYISMVEAKKEAMSLKSLDRVCKVLQIPPQYLAAPRAKRRLRDRRIAEILLALETLSAQDFSLLLKTIHRLTQSKSSPTPRKK